MLELLLSLLDDESNEDTGDQRKSNRHDHTEVEGLARGDTSLVDVEDGEGCGRDLKVDVRVHCLQNGLVHVLVEVRDGHVRS